MSGKPPDEPVSHRLPDGTQLITPAPVGPTSLHVGDWICLKGLPWQITDLTTYGDAGGRIVHFEQHRPLRVLVDEAVPVYRQLPPPDPESVRL